MFDNHDSGVGLVPGESPESVMVEDEVAYETTCRELADGWEPEGRHVLPDLGSIVPGPYLAAVLEGVDRSRLNGFDLVRLLQARERQIAHVQAGSMADMVDISYSAPGGRDSDPVCLQQAFEFASDEVRTALTLTRRAAESRLGLASDVVERLPRVFALLFAGSIDVAKTRVFVFGTEHLSPSEARAIVDRLAAVAPKLTTGQLRARIRRLCVEVDPGEAKKREETAYEDRRLVIEPTEAGTADLHLFGLRMGDARAIGRRVNGHMISLKREDRSGRAHDQLRADIARDLLLGDQAAGGGQGLVDIHVPASTLDGGSEPAEIGGLGPVTADTARHIVAAQPEAEHRLTIVDDDGNPTHVHTLTRRATKTIRRHVETLQPTCSLPGCRMPAADCDQDHQTAWSDGGETSTTNLGPKCRHDHRLKDHGWSHHRNDDEDIWISPLGHTYVTQGQSP